MENKSHALAAGIFTLLLSAAAVLLALWLSRDQTDYVPYQLATKHSIPGLNPHAEVRYRGLDIGRVDDITFDPEVPGQILIHIRVRPDTPVTHSTFATLGYQGVTGIAYVELDDDGSSKTHLPSSEDRIARIEMRPGLLGSLQDKGLAILQQTEELTRRLNQMLASPNQQAILDAFDNVSAAARSLQAIPQQLQPALAKMPQVLDQAQQSMASMSALSRDLARTVENLHEPDGAIARFAAAADQVGSVAQKIELETLPLAADARSSLRAINRTLENLNNNPPALLFGQQGQGPGPGEEGFTAPSK